MEETARRRRVDRVHNLENARLLGELRERNEEIAGWNRDLETRVEWPVEDQALWLQMAAMAFRMAYGAKKQIEIKVAGGSS